MAFNRPTLQDLITRVEGDLKSGLNLLTILRRSFLGVIARVLAGLSHLLFGYLKFIEKQAFPDTATDEYLERWSSIWGVTRKVATYSQFEVDVTGTNGTNIPAGTVYKRSDGKEFTVDVSQTIAGGVATLALTATEPGADSEVLLNDIISISSPIAGLVSEATVSLILIEPEDTETDDSLRARLVDKIQNPPSGGAANDYIQWALEVPGISRAWVLPQNAGPGTVGVAVVSDDEDPITPSPAKITETQDYIDERRPVTANVTVFAPVLLDLDLDIELKPNTAEVQAAVLSELQDLIFRDASLAGAYKSPSETFDGKILLSRINEAISIAIGEVDHNITLINGVAPADVTPATGELVVLGVINWSPLP